MKNEQELGTMKDELIKLLEEHIMLQKEIIDKQRKIIAELEEAAIGQNRIITEYECILDGILDKARC